MFDFILSLVSDIVFWAAWTLLGLVLFAGFLALRDFQGRMGEEPRPLTFFITLLLGGPIIWVMLVYYYVVVEPRERKKIARGDS